MEKISSLTFLTRNYYLLTKPGIVMGNAITVIAGFTLASKGAFDFSLFLAVLVGLSLIIASACVFNNYIDRTIDKKMERTKNRVLVKGLISNNRALIYGAILGTVGTYLLVTFVNLLTVSIALLGFVVYVGLYSFLKTRSIYGTLIGSVAGATPPVVGYCAVSNQLDLGAWIFFAILVLWQMPHFYAIAIFRLNDYANASVPLLPVKKGVYKTKKQMVFYIIAFTIAAVMLTLCKYVGYMYFLIVLLLGFLWLRLCMKGFMCKDDVVWARKMFFFSLVVIVVLSMMIPFNTYHAL